MKTCSLVLVGLWAFVSGPVWGRQQNPAVRVYISVDMEGVSGVVHGEQTGGASPEYQRFRRLMNQEVNAAIEGALAGGATAIVVNDSHGSHRNLMIEELLPPAQLISNFFKPAGMMEGLDASFDAVFFIGYHAKAGTPSGVLAHTGSGIVQDLRVNGLSVGEAGMNILAAGSVGVPVVLITGDDVAVAQARELVPQIEGVVVKEAIGVHAARLLRPEQTREMIRQGARRAVERRKEIAPSRRQAPFRFELAYGNTAYGDVASQIPGVERVDARTIAYTTTDYLAGYRFLRVLYRYLRAD